LPHVCSPSWRARNLAPDSNLKAYLLKAVANRARDYLSARRDTSVDWDADTEPPCPKTQAPLSLVSSEEEAIRLWRAVTNLPDEQRLVVALHIRSELTLKEIAEIEGISENTAQSRYRYALEKLRRVLTGVDQ
jgi:RNA polymerase sigma factor (sigma-70 family)